MTEARNVGTHNAGSFRPTRRWFGKAIAAGSALAATPLSSAAWASSSSTRAFEVDAKDGYFVTLGAGAHFDVAVKDRRGTVVERHPAVNGYSVAGLQSQYFSVRGIDAPS